MICIVCLVSSFNNGWLLQGYEKHLTISILNFGSKIIMVLILYFAFQYKLSATYYALLFVLIDTAAAIFSTMYIGLYMGIWPWGLKIYNPYYEIRRGVPILISNISGATYLYFNPIIIEKVSGPAIAAAYATAYKIATTTFKFISPLLSRLLPRLASKQDDLLKISELQKAFISIQSILLIVLVLSFFVVINAENLILITGNVPSSELISGIRVLMLLPIILTLATYYIYRLTVLNKLDVIKYIYLGAALLNFVAIYNLSPGGLMGSILAIIAVEIAVLFLLYASLHVNQPNAST